MLFFYFLSSFLIPNFPPSFFKCYFLEIQKDQTSLLSLYHQYLLLLDLHSLQSLHVKPKVQTLQQIAFPPSCSIFPSTSNIYPQSPTLILPSPSLPPSSPLLPPSSSLFPTFSTLQQLNGKLSLEERRKKIFKYKEKLRKWREIHPISRGFVGRKLVARNKPRLKGKFIKQNGVENKKIKKM